MSKITNNKKLIFVLGAVFGIVLIVGVAIVLTHIDFDTTDYFGEITYVTPENFENDDHNSFRTLSYLDSDNDTYCYVDIDSYSKELYSDAKYIIENYVHFDLKDEVSDLEEFSVSGKKAYKINIKSMGDLSLDNISYYSIDSSNYVYLIKYTVYDYKKGDREDLDTNVCYTSRDAFIKSIQVK